MKNLLFIFLMPVLIMGQPYEKARTSHRFAQSSFGMDLCSMFGGNSVYAVNDSISQKFNINPSLSPRIHMGGLHFWGHIEFYFNINLIRFALKKDPVKVSSSVGDVVGLKIFPKAVKFGKPAIYIGTGLTGIDYRQINNGQSTASYNKLVLPTSVGLFYYKRKWGVDVSCTYIFNSNVDLYYTKKAHSTIHTPPFILNVGVRKLFETTASAEKDRKSGKSDSVFKMLRRNKKLSSWFFGIAPSSAFYLREPSNNAATYDFMGKGLNSIFPELGIGYYYDPLRVHSVITSRYVVLNKKAFDVHQRFERLAIGFESFWYFANYHGFVPYAGLNYSYEKLRFKETDNLGKKDFTYEGFKPGIVIGWDIMVEKFQHITLRTNIRYFPNMGIDIGGSKKVWLDQIEFNFIEFVYYPGRKKKVESVWYE